MTLLFDDPRNTIGPEFCCELNARVSLVMQSLMKGLYLCQMHAFFLNINNVLSNVLSADLSC